jgi:DNA ligase (NAD+)
MLSIANVYSEEEMREFVKAAEEGIAALQNEREIPGHPRQARTGAGNDTFATLKRTG